MFCGGAAADDTTTSHGVDSTLVGQSLRDITDRAGKKIGKELYTVAAEGELGVVE